MIKLNFSIGYSILDRFSNVVTSSMVYGVHKTNLTYFFTMETCLITMRQLYRWED